jgi:hypothetical protein
LIALTLTAGKKNDFVRRIQWLYRYPVSVEPDAHGQAALLLTESLIHMLVEQGVLTNLEAIEVVHTAAEVKVEVANALGESAKRMNESLTLLAKMQSSFESDQPRHCI